MNGPYNQISPSNTSITINRSAVNPYGASWWCFYLFCICSYLSINVLVISHDAESIIALEDCLSQFLMEDLFRLIFWQFYCVEAGMSDWQSILVLSIWFFNYKGKIMIINGNLRSPGNELQKPIHFTLVKLRYYFPEPFYHLTSLCVPLLILCFVFQLHV